MTLGIKATRVLARYVPSRSGCRDLHFEGLCWVDSYMEACPRDGRMILGSGTLLGFQFGLSSLGFETDQVCATTPHLLVDCCKMSSQVFKLETQLIVDRWRLAFIPTNLLMSFNHHARHLQSMVETRGSLKIQAVLIPSSSLLQDMKVVENQKSARPKHPTSKGSKGAWM